MFDFGAVEMPDTILVLDTETTGLEGARFTENPYADRFSSRVQEIDYDSMDWSRFGDVVVDVGICEVSLSERTVKEVYSSLVGYDVSTWTEEMRDAWIFGNSDLTVDQVAAAKPFSEVRSEVMGIVKGKWLTTYNVQFDLDKFLYRFPWDLKGEFNECRDIMFAASDVCRLEQTHEGRSGYRYPKLDYAYENLLDGNDPAGIKGVQRHRALSDAKMASFILLELDARGAYEPLDMSGRHGSAY